MEYKSLDFLGYNGYRINNQGKVECCLKRGRIISNNWKEIIGSKHKRGYRQLFLSNGIKKQCFCVHKLVALAFIPNPNNYVYVLHNDGNCNNNCVTNLRWGTQKDNIQDAIKHGTFKQNFAEENNPKNKLTKLDVLEIKKLLLTNLPQTKIAKLFNIGESVISDIKHGKIWKHI